MKRYICFLIVIGLHLSSTCPATDLAPDQLWQGQADIQFFGTSTLHNFSGKAPCETFNWQVSTDPNKGEPVIQADIDVLVQKMDTHNKGRDKNMVKMFQIKKYPNIHGTLQDANLAEFKPLIKTTNSDQPPQEVPGTMPFLLTIRDQQQEVDAKVSHYKAGPKEITFTLDFEVSLKAFGLKAPSVMGIIRVGDRVRLQANVTLSPPVVQKEAAVTNTAPYRLTISGSQQRSLS